MKVQDVYEKYGTPLNLRQHMLLVAGIVRLLQQSWTGRKVDWDTVITAALLHDLGNVVKFDLEKHPGLLGPEQSRIQYWRKVKKATIEKYGSNDHIVTDKMLKEINVSERVRQLILEKSFGNSIHLRSSSDIEAKLLLYCDLRVLPSGVGSLKERLDDIAKRLTTYSERPDFDQLVAACYDIEGEIVESVSGDLNEAEEDSSLETSFKDSMSYEV